MKNNLLTLFTLLFLVITDVNAQISPCNLAGGSVYIDHASAPWMMNATVNGMSLYDYSWTDTNGVVISTANQTSFYTSWCVTITDNLTGCDTIICQDCLPDSLALCMCPMIYMPVCGCDGVMYANYCLADCADVSWTPAISNGMPGGWLPCSQPPSCEVDIVGDSIVCSSGIPQVLTAVPVGNGTAPYTYSWSNGLSNSPILTITNPGTYCVTVTDANGCVDSSCFTVALEEIIIHSTPNPPIICLSDSIWLMIDSNDLNNMIWTTITWNGPAISTNMSSQIEAFPVISSAYVVEAIDSAGCDRRGEFFVTVDSCNNNPCVVEINNGTMDIEVCDGDTAILEATNGFDTYSWALNGSTGSLLGTTHIVYATNAGIYTVIVTDSTNCVDIDSIEVIVYASTPLNPITVPDPPSICLGDSIVIEVSSSFVNYFWNTGNPNDQGEDRVVIFPSQDFTYVVEALDVNGCESREEIFVLVDTCATGLIQILSSQVVVFPNPSSSEVSILLPKSELFSLEIYHMNGSLIISHNDITDRYVIKKNFLARGVYFIKLTHKEGLITKKMIIE